MKKIGLDLLQSAKQHVRFTKKGFANNLSMRRKHGRAERTASVHPYLGGKSHTKRNESKTIPVLSHLDTRLLMTKTA